MDRIVFNKTSIYSGSFAKLKEVYVGRRLLNMVVEHHQSCNLLGNRPRNHRSLRNHKIMRGEKFTQISFEMSPRVFVSLVLLSRFLLSPLETLRKEGQCLQNSKYNL